MMQKVFGNDCLSRPTIYKCFKRVKKSREDLNDDERSGRSKSAANEGNVEIVREFIKKSRNLRSERPNSQCYVSSWCYEAFAGIRRTRPEYREKGSWRLLHDNAPAHRSTLIADFLTKNGILTINHSPYSPYLASYDLYLFPKLH